MSDLLKSTSIEESLGQIEKAINFFPKKRNLSDKELSFYKDHNFKYGWEISDFTGISQFSLRVLIGNRLPFQLPRIAVYPSPKLFTWPHLENYGLLCMAPSGSTYNINNLSEITIFLLNEALKLVSTCIQGTNSDEFRDEFQSYWARWKEKEDKYNFYSLCLPKGPSRMVSAWQSDKGVYIADNEEQLRLWLKNRYPTSKILDISKIPLLWLPQAPTPSEFRFHQVRSLRNMFADDNISIELLDEHLFNRNHKFKSILFGFSGKNGVGFGGYRAKEPSDIDRNFRPNKISKNTLINRFEEAQVYKATVDRIDHSWIHGRDQNHTSRELKDKTVLLLGTGSVGSGIAELLAKSGIGKLILVDSDIMESANASRHALGINSIGHSKSQTLAIHLRNKYPHLSIEHHIAFAEDYLNKTNTTEGTFDLIISSIGDTLPEFFIASNLKKQASAPPIIFSWLEEHAMAGHTILLGNHNGCIGCLMDKKGTPLVPATKWDGDQNLTIPSCGGQFQPYGAIECSHLHGITSELALEALIGSVSAPTHRVWIGRTSILNKKGGQWNPHWESTHGEIGTGGTIFEPTFTKNPDCILCGEQR